MVSSMKLSEEFTFLCYGNFLKNLNMLQNDGNVEEDCFMVQLKSILSLESLTNQVVENVI